MQNILNPSITAIQLYGGKYLECTPIISMQIQGCAYFIQKPGNAIMQAVTGYASNHRG